MPRNQASGSVESRATLSYDIRVSARFFLKSSHPIWAVSSVLVFNLNYLLITDEGRRFSNEMEIKHNPDDDKYSPHRY